ASTPVRALATDARSSGRPTATTSTPRAARSATRFRPMKPVAPVTAMRLTNSPTHQFTNSPIHQLFLVDPVDLVSACPHLFRWLVDVAVVLEDPRKLGAEKWSPRQLPMQLEDQQRIEPEWPVCGVHTEQQQPDLVHVTSAQQQPHESQRKQPAVGPFERLIDVGDRDGAGDGPAVDFGEHGAARVENRLQLNREPAELGFGRRHEPPVAFPRPTVDDAQPLDLPGELREVQRPDDDALPLADAGGELCEDRRRLTIELVDPREQVLDFLVTRRLDLRAVLAWVVGHHDHRIAVE